MYLNFNHNEKTFETSKALFNKYNTKLLKNEQALFIKQLEQNSEYIGKCYGYGGCYMVKKASALLLNDFSFLPDNQYIEHKLIGTVCYIFKQNLIFSCELMKAYIDIIYKRYYEKHTSCPFNYFMFDKQANQYLNKNLQDFFKKNGCQSVFNDSEQLIQGLLENKELKIIVDEVIKFVFENMKTIEDLETYSKNLI